jgi:predicted esterase YcpF (UPF0227 family)
MIFYFHGFASGGNSWKIGELKRHLPNETIIAPTLPVDPEEVVTFFERVTAENGKPALLIGSSLGGFYAYYAATRFNIPAVLINPSITPWKGLQGYIGINQRYYSGEPFEWKKQYLDSLKKLSDEIDSYGPEHHLLHFFLSTDDEVLDLKVIPGHFPTAGSIRFYDNCRHSFTRFIEIIPEIERLVGRLVGRKQ